MSGSTTVWRVAGWCSSRAPIMESFDVTDRARGLAVGPPPAASMEPTDEREYLCVDGFLTTLIDARALKTAFELRVIDRLAAHEALGVADLATGVPGGGRGPIGRGAGRGRGE